VRRICRYSLFVLPLICLQFANAQSGVDFAVGFGAAFAPAAKTGLDAALNPCVLGSGTAANPCQKTPSLSTFMLGVNGDLMLWKRFGVGGEVNFEPGKKDYVILTQQAAGAGGPAFTEKLQSRITLYDFNGILQPIKTKRASVKISGGIGGANVKFYDSGSSTSGLLGTQNFSQYFASSNHFQVHAGGGLQLYVSEHMFIRPEVNIHYVHNLNQFGRDSVIRATVWVGYTFGQ
jgi:hypothetical protein